jgi:hypothetical protein
MGLALAVIGAGCLAFSSFGLGARADADDELASRGLRTVAHVIQKGERSDWIAERLRPVYHLRYQFEDHEGNEWQGVSDVSEVTWKQSGIGRPLPIRYLPNDPTINRAEQPLMGHFDTDNVIMSVIAALFLLVGGWLIVSAAWRAARRARVVLVGDPIMARITDVQRIDNYRASHIEYVFTDGRGNARDGRTPPLSKQLASRWNVGDPILVLCRNGDVIHHEADVYGARATDLARLLKDDA